MVHGLVRHAARYGSISNHSNAVIVPILEQVTQSAKLHAQQQLLICQLLTSCRMLNSSDLEIAADSHAQRSRHRCRAVASPEGVIFTLTPIREACTRTRSIDKSAVRLGDEQDALLL